MPPLCRACNGYHAVDDFETCLKRMDWLEELDREIASLDSLSKTITKTIELNATQKAAIAWGSCEVFNGIEFCETNQKTKKN